MTPFVRPLLLVLALMLTAAAPAAAATTTQLYGDRGGSAVADFHSSNACVDQSVHVFATTSATRPHTGVTTYAQVAVSATDTCTGEESLLFGVLGPVEHRQTDARVGRVTGQVELVDWNTGSSAGLHALDVEVRALGRPEHGRGGLVHRYPGGQMVYRAVGSWTEASAVGRLVAPDGTDLLAGQTGTGWLDWHSQVQVSLTRSVP